MHPNHQRAVQRVTEHFQQDPTILALLIAGSVAKGWAAPTSDLDVMFIVSDEEFARRAETNAVLYYSPDFVDYEGGYIDGKYVSISFLEEIAATGSEPARAAFAHTRAAFSRIGDLSDLLARVTAYPEAERDAKLRAFYSQTSVAVWFMKEADKRGSTYLRTRAAADLTLYASRLILAYNRILYPFHKWLMHEVARAPEKPADFEALIDAVLDEPTPANADALLEAINAFHNWDVPFQETFIHFLHDSEWNWRMDKRSQHPPIYDW